MAKIATEPGFLSHPRAMASTAAVAPNAAISQDDAETVRGARLDRAQSELTRRGYRLVHTDGSAGVQYWWNRKDGHCMRVHVQDSVVDAADMLPVAECSRALELPQPDRGY